MRQFADLQETWKQSIKQWIEFVKDGSSPDSLSPKALREMFAPARWSGRGTGAFDADLQQVNEGPRYATACELDHKVAGLQQLAMRCDKSAAARAVQRAWNTAFKRFMKSASSAKAQAPTTWRGLTDHWLAVANEAMIEAQSRMLRSASDYRLPERELAEAWCDACHAPGPRRQPRAVGRQHRLPGDRPGRRPCRGFRQCQVSGRARRGYADWLRERH
jgi:hypothetical protein